MTRVSAVLTVVGEDSYRRAARASVRALLARTDLEVVVGADDVEGLELPAHERITVLPIEVRHVQGRPDPFLAKFRTVTGFLRSGAPLPDAVLLIDVDAVVVSGVSADEVVALLDGRDFAMAEQPGITGSTMARADFLRHYLTHALPVIDAEAPAPSLEQFRYFNSGVVVARPDALLCLAEFALDRSADPDRAHVQGEHMVADQDYFQYWCTTVHPGSCTELSTDWNHCRWWDADYPRQGARIRHLSNFTEGPIEDTLVELEAASVDDGLAAVVVTHQSGALLGSCLRAVRDAGVHEVVVVDNASTDGSAAIGRADGAVVVEEPLNRGFAGAVNRALVLVPTSHVVLVNPDLLLDAETVRAGVSLIEGEARTIAVPDLVDSDGLVTAGVQPGYTRLKLILDLLDGRGWTARLRWARRLPAHHARSWQWPIGACLFARTTDLDALRGLDAGYFVYMEDVDLGRRWSRAGGRIVSTGTAVRHESSTGADISAQRRRQLLDAARLRFAEVTYGRPTNVVARWAATGGDHR